MTERRYGQWARNEKGYPEDTTRCIKEVHEQGRGGGFYQCQNKRGYGPDGLYCKKHIPQSSKETAKIVYCCEVTSWNTYRLSEVNVAGETDKTYDVISSTGIIGDVYLNKGRVQKKDYHFCNTRQEAISYLAHVAREQAKRMQVKAREIFAKAAELEEMLDD